MFASRVRLRAVWVWRTARLPATTAMISAITAAVSRMRRRRFAALLRAGFVFVGAHGRIQVLALGRIELVAVIGGPFARRVEAGTAVEIGRLASGAVPQLGRGAEAALQPQAVAVLFEPRPQPRPLANERLVRDLRGSVVERDEPGLGEPFEQRVDLGLRSAGGHEIVDRRRAGGCPPRRRRSRSAAGRGSAARAAVDAGVSSTISSAERAIADSTPPVSR